MAEKLDPRQELVTVEELIRACLYEQDATRRVLVRKGLLTNGEVLKEIKVGGRWRGNGGGEGEAAGLDTPCPVRDT